ncbi:MAG: glycosyltransferase [Deltaproteobacteria bacterium]|nr:glycosyltransferase [Deltaproteobacteria bacterium]
MGTRWSVAVASFREQELLDDCLAGILPQARELSAEVVVARAGAVEGTSSLSASHPEIRVIAAPADASVPLLRGLALEACRGQRVALTEDHCVPQPGWLAALDRAHDKGAEVAGGAMGNARTDRALDCGAFFAEYGFFGPDAAGEGQPFSPTGANVSYLGDLAREIGAWFSDGLWENVANQRLAARSTRVAFAPEALIHQNHTYALGAFCRDRFEHGLAYARRRLIDEGGPKRWVYLGFTPLLPFLLLRRVAGAARRGREGEFLRALPFTLVFLAAWSVGEAAGYLRGPGEAEDVN